MFSFKILSILLLLSTIDLIRALELVNAGLARDDTQFLSRARRDIVNAVKQVEIVTAHNNLRRGEGATNMNDLVWNDKLAIQANAWALNCNFAHGNDNTAVAPYTPVGQNLYAKKPGPTSINAANYTAIIQKWFNEKAYYDYDNRYCPPTQMCGHYTQVVWADTKEIGCAAAICLTLGGTGTPAWTNALLVVCNYGPAGNYVGQPPYLKA